MKKENEMAKNNNTNNIDYGYARGLTTYGIIGVKVWICKGDFQLV